jgi:hypothetical protein
LGKFGFKAITFVKTIESFKWIKVAGMGNLQQHYVFIDGIIAVLVLNFYRGLM